MGGIVGYDYHGLVGSKWYNHLDSQTSPGRHSILKYTPHHLNETRLACLLRLSETRTNDDLTLPNLDFPYLRLTRQRRYTRLISLNLTTPSNYLSTND